MTRPVKWNNLVLAVILYADDICILSETAAGMREGIKMLDTFCTNWNLVEISKTQVIVLNSHNKALADSFEYRGRTLEVVTSFRYLGVTFTRKHECRATVESLCGQAHKAMMSLRQHFHNFEFTPFQKYKLFLQTIEPILSYGSEVWGTEDDNQMEILHRCFLREILGVRKGNTAFKYSIIFNNKKQEIVILF